MNPGDQLEAPLAGIQAHDLRAQVEQPDGQLQQRTGERRIVDVGRLEAEQQRQAGRAAEESM